MGHLGAIQLLRKRVLLITYHPHPRRQVYSDSADEDEIDQRLTHRIQTANGDRSVMKVKLRRREEGDWRQLLTDY